MAEDVQHVEGKSVMLSSQAVANFGSISVPGRVRLSNEDAYRCADDLGLYVVADGLGGLPAGEAASQISVYALPRIITRALRHPAIQANVSLGALLRDALILLNRHLYQQSRASSTLEGMATTLVSLVFEGKHAHVVHAGDSRAYLVRKGRCAQLTKDHARKVSTRPGHPPDSASQGLLTEYLVMPGEVNPDINTVALEGGDRFLLCTDGLCGPVANDVIGDILNANEDPTRACQALADAANERGGPDNITCVVVDWRGFHKGQFEVPVPDAPKAGPETLEFVDRMRAALTDLEKDLEWLLTGARETSQESHLRSLAAAKRLLGAETYLDFVMRNPSNNPLHVFHQVCSDSNGVWRKTYEAHKMAFYPLLTSITGAAVRISPLLEPFEVGSIFKCLWDDWGKVEKRYFQTCKRKALHDQEKSLDYLISHMCNSVRTVVGLTELLPRMAINLG
jgi:protein phosphatase